MARGTIWLKKTDGSSKPSVSCLKGRSSRVTVHQVAVHSRRTVRTSIPGGFVRDEVAQQIIEIIATGISIYGNDDIATGIHCLEAGRGWSRREPA
jgi:hypothetical protein